MNTLYLIDDNEQIAKIKNTVFQTGYYDDDGNLLAMLEIPESYEELFRFRMLNRQYVEDISMFVEQFLNTYKDAKPYADRNAPTPGNVVRVLQILWEFMAECPFGRIEVYND